MSATSLHAAMTQALTERLRKLFEHIESMRHGLNHVVRLFPLHHTLTKNPS